MKGWLLRDGEVVCAVEVAEGRAARARGLLGQDGLEGGLLLPGTRSVHTFGMRFPVDVAFCDRDLTVLAVVCPMPRYRITRPRLRARYVLEAEAGAFDRWRLRPGDKLEVKA